jgi:hypothetical protein
MAGSELPRTPLRAAYERVRALPLVQQMRECVDLLENPTVLASELAEAYVLLESTCEPIGAEELAAGSGAPAAGSGEDEAELTLEHFGPGREVRVVGASAEPLFDFACLSGSLYPLAPGADPAPDGGLDYVGLLREPAAPGTGPVLGVVESLGDATPYALLLRLLACLTELAPAAQAERLERGLFKGALGSSPVIDLHLVLWRPPGKVERIPGSEHRSLFELTRDLAEIARSACAETPQLGAALGSILCLRMDPDDFRGTLVLEWRV